MEEMTWLEKIKEGMELIASGCDDNKSWEECAKCPFEKYCDAIHIGAEAGLEVEIPEGWWH